MGLSSKNTHKPKVGVVLAITSTILNNFKVVQKTMNVHCWPKKRKCMILVLVRSVFFKPDLQKIAILRLRKAGEDLCGVERAGGVRLRKPCNDNDNEWIS